MACSGKRGRQEAFSENGTVHREDPPTKAARLSGVNVIEVNGKACTHEVAWPPSSGGSTLPVAPRQGPPAKQYPFSLDPFQQTAIDCLEAGHSVLVAAHTSAGKTVVAEYAFAMALRDKQRVIYTSPLKALSNQKYREFYEEFQDVGLMTGDVTINPGAACLVMTTEILRSMLYNGSEVVRETALIVYDEIHYLRDKERGVVWEESIILAPKTARFAFLSATIPNAREFAEWIATTHGSPCHVVYTDYRPTPLQHYMFPAGGDGLYMVVDEKGAFRSDNFHKALAAMEEAGAEAGRARGQEGSRKEGRKETGNGEDSDIYKIVKLLMTKEFDPVIIFSFSKKECEALALQMAALDLNTDDEKAIVERVFSNAVDILAEDDRRLPQLASALPMLKRGIGVHHSGLLPILKEVIEIMFQEGLIKVLFATETFSTGLNMPAKTVVFTHARKFDGAGFRWLSSGEYIQMSGRAGRRGLDDRGIVVLMLDAKMDPSIARGMVKGSPDTLHSEFRLSYSMLLNLLLRGDSEPETLMRASYRQFQAERSLPSLQATVERLQEEMESIHVEDEEAVAQLLEIYTGIAALKDEVRAHMFTPRAVLPFLNPGRLVRVLVDAPGSRSRQESKEGEEDNERAASGASASSCERASVWGVLVSFEKLGRPQDGAEDGSSKKRKGQASFVVDVLLNCAEHTNGQSQRRRPKIIDPGVEEGTPQVVALTLSDLDALSSVRLYLPKDLRPVDARRAALKGLGEVGRRFPDGIPMLDPEDDLGLKDDAFRKTLRKLEKLEGLLAKHPLISSPTLEARLSALRHKVALKAQLRAAKREVKTAASLILQDELKARRRVLRRLGYVEDSGVVSQKGRVAAEIQSADELLLTELIFTGGLTDARAEDLVALVSCLVWTEKSDAGVRLREDLEKQLARLRSEARKVGKAQADAKLGTDVDEYVASFRPELMEVVAAWARGAKFAEIAKMTDVFEGSLVRAVRRVEEILRQMMSGATVIGDVSLRAKFEEASTHIKRDIIFAASLYL